MATDQLINKAQGDAIISGLTAIKNAINEQPVPTQVEDVVADAFDVGVSYVPGDYCIYENKLYVCDVAHHGAWDGNDFTLTTVGAVLESLNNELSHVGMIIHSTTLDTEAKVKAIYGSNTSWIQHSGYVLRGATSGVTANSATKTGGTDNTSFVNGYYPNAAIPGVNTGYGLVYNSTTHNNTGANIPNYKSVYIWERTA